MKRVFKFVISEWGRLTVGAVFFVAAIILDLLALNVAAIVLYAVALAVCGWDVFISAVRGIIRRDLFDEKFLMSIASVGAMIIGEYREGVAVMLFFLLGEIFEHKAVTSSRKRIRSLIDICADDAVVLTEDGEVRKDAEDILIGEILVLRAGDRLPCDAAVISGDAEVDTSSLTGEAMPRHAGEGDELNSGMIILNGAIKARVIRLAEDSGAQRIINMVEEASERKSKEERFITSFSKVYTPTVVLLALLIATIPPIFKLMELGESVYRALIFLVISCPCALVISVPMAFFGGIGCSASKGILFKGGSAFSPISKLSAVAFDKTGTLTNGEFEIKGTVEAANGDELLSLMAAVEYGSNHPIALAFRRAYPDALPAESIKELAGMGSIGICGGREIAVGNNALMKSIGARVPDRLLEAGENYVFCAIDKSFAGAALISDTVKPEAKFAAESLCSLGIKKTLILSGDKRKRAEKLADEIGIDEVYAELMPKDKYDKLGELIESTEGKVAFVGDGINDSPSLTLADVGIAMGALGSDSAIEAADVIIASDNLLRIPEAIKIARKTLAIAKQNIVFALGVKIAILILGALGIANMWLAVFADVGVAALAILNSMRALKA